MVLGKIRPHSNRKVLCQWDLNFKQRLEGILWGTQTLREAAEKCLGAGHPWCCELCAPPRFHFPLPEYRFRKQVFHIVFLKLCRMPFCVAEQYRLQRCHFPPLPAVPCSVSCFAASFPWHRSQAEQPRGLSAPSRTSHCPSLFKTALVASDERL